MQPISTKRIKIGTEEHKISQFADDTAFILDGSKSFLGKNFNCFRLFKKISGLDINQSKCYSVWIGCKKFMGKHLIKSINLNIMLICFFARHNCFLFSTNLDETVNLNYNKRIKEI